MAIRWQKMTHRTHGPTLMVGVDGWTPVLATGSTVGTPLTQAVYATTMADFDTTNVVGYMKDPWGFVHMQGSVRWTGTGATMTATADILTLPVGYRPLVQAGFVVGNSASTTPLKVSKVTVGTDGKISFLGYETQANAEARTYMSPISFRAEDI